MIRLFSNWSKVVVKIRMDKSCYQFKIWTWYSIYDYFNLFTYSL